MIREVHLEHSTWNELPHKFEAGTMNIAQAVGLGAAVHSPRRSGDGERSGARAEVGRVRLPEALRDWRYHRLRPRKDRTGLISFFLPDVHPHDLSQLLDEEGVAIRSGHHCAQPLMRRLGVGATARASFYLTTQRKRWTLCLRRSNVPAGSSERWQDEHDARALHSDPHGPLPATPQPGRTGEP